MQPDVRNVRVLPGQERLLLCKAEHILFVAGVASGKTEGGARWCFKQLYDQPGAVGFIGAQSYQQLARISLPAVMGLLDSVGIEYCFNKKPPDEWGGSRFVEHERVLSIRLPGYWRSAQILTGTMDNYHAHRGISVGWFWLDESRDMDEEAYDVMLSRLRGQPQGTNYRGLMTTTPNGFSWLYRRFVAKPAPNSEIIRAATTENPYLPPGFVETLRAQYTERFAKQEIDGEFLSLTSGMAFHSFSRQKHVSQVLVKPDQPMFYSQDFNVSPLASVYGQHDKIRSDVAGEIYIVGSARTADAAEEFCRRMKDHKNKRVVIYGDMSGANQSTRSDQTDYTILEQTMKKAGWATETRRNYQNPPLIESVETVNAHLEHERGRIDPSCVHLIQDLEMIAWKEGTRILDKSNADLTHAGDAYRYFLQKEFGVGSKATTSNILN